MGDDTPRASADPYAQHMDVTWSESQSVGLSDLVHMVSATTGDIMSVCERKPEVCVTADNVMGSIRRRAANWTRTFHDWLSDEPIEVDETRGQNAHALAQN